MRPEGNTEHSLRVLIVSTSYLPVLGGVQTVAHQVASYMNKCGHQVQVFTMHHPRHLPHHENLDGVSIERLFFSRPSLNNLLQKRPDLFLASCFYYFPVLRHISRFVRSFQPQTVHFHFPTHLTPFVLYLRQHFSFRLVVSLHGHDVLGNSQRPTSLQVQFRRLLRQSDAITTCSEDLRRTVISMQPEIADRVRVHYNGVDLTRFEDQVPFQHPRPYILFVGRLTYTKGVDLLLQAFAQVNFEHPDVDLIIAGDGPFYEELSELTLRLNLKGSVHFLGRAGATEVVRLMNGCLFVVVPSRTEQFGIVAVEAMAAGKAVIASCVGGLSEVLPVPPNLLISPGVESLSTSMGDWLAHHDEVRLKGEQNRIHARKFDLSSTLRQFETTLTEDRI